MLMMRLQRVGRRNDPSYRVVVVNKRTGPKSNKNVAILGSYNPKLNHVQLDTEKVKHWLAQGVQPSDTMHNLLVSQKVIDAPKRNVLPRKTPIVDEAAQAAAAAEAAEPAAEEASETAVEATTADETAEPEAEAPAETESKDEATEATDTEEAAETPEAEAEKATA